MSDAMTTNDDDPRRAIDVRVNSPQREGLAGTAPAELYSRSEPRETITIAPDARPDSEQPAWRQDFPIDWPQDQYVERRDFVKFLVLTSAAFTAGQFTIVAQSMLQSPARPDDRLIASLDTLPVNGSIVFEYPGAHDICVLVRRGETDLVAYSQKCTHLSCAVIPRPEEGVLHCPCHEGVFDLASGRPLAGPPTRPLPRIVLELRGRDIYATGVEVQTT
jgi:nitrite reductase/ring-hydroxylating ferredoxin subunit